MSTQADTAGAGTTEANKRVARRYFEELVNGQRIEVLAEVVAADAADETRVGVGGSGTRADFQEHVEWLWKSVKELEVTVDDLVAEGDRVIVFWTIAGIHEGTVFGVEGTGRRFRGRSISSLTVRDGQVVRYNVLPDRLGIVQQLTAPAV
ncbi:ester cyclase [Streptacidiphilus sp. PB12-B1b]|uniref:ester cyclase n=1 Tax=Streptacidiphilus sp. PB12-B1b TaxID=2705012 RepID=UPI0015FAC43C|nr:ester cyclase [Streptacidiphilus sp. PB12-B1b]QMU77009.1 ester cyclase [Streptacidiphilus sp. PB12-B1b]